MFCCIGRFVIGIFVFGRFFYLSSLSSISSLYEDLKWFATLSLSASLKPANLNSEHYKRIHKPSSLFGMGLGICFNHVYWTTKNGFVFSSEFLHQKKIVPGAILVTRHETPPPLLDSLGAATIIHLRRVVTQLDS